LEVGKGLADSNEAQLEDDFVKPILRRILGHAIEVQVPLNIAGQNYRLDYAFFRSEDERRKAKKLHGKEYFERTLAIGDAKYWNRPLDRRIKKQRDVDGNINPSMQINNYLLATGRKWGLLTNGRHWRLYNRDTSFSLDSFYEVDLVKLMDQNATEAFKYFYLFFRRQAFEPYDTKPTFLDYVFEESTSYKTELGEDVKNRVYEALRILANGFLKYPKNRLDPVQHKEAIHSNCLILLYRLLFVFFAEARGIMPDHADYKVNFSFDALKKKIRERKRVGETISPVTTEYWTKLRDLFWLIDDPKGYDMPQYNGGLFNPDKHPFLEKYQIGDNAMADAFDLIACAKAKDDPPFVDYRTLDVQHLGSIYEGLLEYKLKLADQDKVVIKGKKNGQELVVKLSHQTSGMFMVMEVKLEGHFMTIIVGILLLIFLWLQVSSRKPTLIRRFL
jgi:hypothetical protein